jgi:CheY-like chemotaxis protein
MILARVSRHAGPWECALTVSGQVLVLDADDEARAALVSDLGILGVQARGVSSLEQGRAALARAPWRAIVMSLQLAEGNPLDLLGNLSEGRPLPPIIVVSRIVRRRDLIRAIRTPVCDFLEQPVSLSTLACALERAATSAGVPPRVSASQPEHVVRAVRQAMVVVVGAEGAAKASARTVAGRPTLRAAWTTIREEEHLPSAGKLVEAAEGMRPMRLAAAVIAAASLAECLRLDGAWQVQAEASALRVLDTARAARSSAALLEVDPDEAFLAAVLRGIGEILLMMQAARRYAGQDPAPELLARLEGAGPRTAGAMLASWGIPAELLRRFAVPLADGSADDSPMSRLLENPGGHAAAMHDAEGAADWSTLLRATRETLRGAFKLSVGADIPLKCRLVTESTQVPLRLDVFGARGARVVLGTDDLTVAAAVLGSARDGLWLDVRLPRNGAQARAPVDVAGWERSTPITADLRFVGPARHADRLRSVALLALNRRRAVRVASDQRNPIVVSLQREDGVTVGDGALIDLSTCGMGLLVDPKLADFLPVGGLVALTVPLPTRPMPVRMMAKVVHAKVQQVEDSGDGTRYFVLRAGMELHPTAGGRVRMEQALTEYIMRRQRETLRRRN